MNVLYYNCFTYFKRIVKDSEPHTRTALFLGLSQGYLLNGLIDFSLVKWYCYSMPLNAFIGIAAVVLFFNCYYYLMKKRGQHVVEKRPNFFGNRSISTITTILYVMIFFLYFFFGAVYMKNLYDGCK